ncbi:Protein quiver [Orchesella cincta]|uniref:Protein quiver n=1 Tax=Orchesella cincta TaxID=48709 RepID=A0A1D2NAU3_ORCCI|nr:Protein quiver [Orchesella cincta]
MDSTLLILSLPWHLNLNFYPDSPLFNLKSFKMKSILAFFAILACIAIWSVPVFGQTNVTKCYQCEYYENGKGSANNDECEESPPPVELLLDCNAETSEKSNDWKCIKIAGMIEEDDENFKYIRRYCTLDKALNVTCKDTKSLETGYGFIKKGKQCVCDDKDGCNTGSSVTIGVATLGAGLILATLSKMLRD